MKSFYFKYKDHSLVVDPIVTIIVGNRAKAFRLSKKLLRAETLKQLGSRVSDVDSMISYLNCLRIVYISNKETK